MREGAIRNAMLVEAVQGIEDIKLLRAEARFQNQWNHMNESSADVSMRQRKIVGGMNACKKLRNSILKPPLYRRFFYCLQML